MKEIDNTYDKVDKETTKSFEIKREKLKTEEENLKEKLKTEVTKVTLILIIIYNIKQKKCLLINLSLFRL